MLTPIIIVNLNFYWMTCCVFIVTVSDMQLVQPIIAPLTVVLATMALHVKELVSDLFFFVFCLGFCLNMVRFLWPS